MIKNKLIHYETQAGFEADRESIADNSIVFVKETNKIYTHGAEYNGVDYGEDVQNLLDYQQEQEEINSHTARIGNEFGEDIVPEIAVDNLLTKSEQTLTFTQKENVINNILNKNENDAVLNYGTYKKYIKYNVIEDVPFNGFVQDVTIEAEDFEGNVVAIYWDTVANYFVAKNDSEKYYLTWPNNSKYNNVSGTLAIGDVFIYNHINYFFNGTTLALTANPKYPNRLNSEMVNESNTIFVIRYDFDLGGNTIVIDETSGILMDGGSINNGTINLNGCKVYPDVNAIGGTNLTINGVGAKGTFYFQNIPTWSNGEYWVDANGKQYITE